MTLTRRGFGKLLLGGAAAVVLQPMQIVKPAEPEVTIPEKRFWALDRTMLVSNRRLSTFIDEEIFMRTRMCERVLSRQQNPIGRVLNIDKNGLATIEVEHYSILNHTGSSFLMTYSAGNYPIQYKAYATFEVRPGDIVGYSGLRDGKELVSAFYPARG
jgi:hypothetical protein